MLDKLKHHLENLRFTPFDQTSESGRAQERQRRVALSALATAAAKLLSIAGSLLSVPLTVAYLGAERYGLWLTLVGLVEMARFADLGIGNGLITEIAAAHGKGQHDRILQLTSSAFVALTGVALFLAMCFSIIIPAVDWAKLLELTSSTAIDEVRPVIWALVGSFLVGIPTSIVSRLQTGLQSAYTPTMWSAFGSLTSLVGLIIVTQLRLGLVPLALVLAGAPTFANLANSIWFFSGKGRDLRPRIGDFRTKVATRLVRVGSLFTALQVASSFGFLSDNVVLAATFGADRVPELALPAKMFAFLLLPTQMLAVPLWPAYGEAASRGDGSWVKRTLVRTTLMCIVVTVVGSVFLLMAGQRLVEIWSRGEIHAALSVFVPIALSTILTAWGSSVASFLNGVGRLKEQIYAALAMAVVSFSLKWILAPRLGIEGVSWATVIAYFVCVFIPLSWTIRSTVRDVLADDRP